MVFVSTEGASGVVLGFGLGLRDFLMAVGPLAGALLRAGHPRKELARKDSRQVRRRLVILWQENRGCRAIGLRDDPELDAIAVGIDGQEPELLA
jgi:hypothetical protein